MLPCGARLHLQHGPIDLILSADGAQRRAAFAAARARFDTVLDELVAELPLLRRPLGPDVPRPTGDDRAPHARGRPALCVRCRHPMVAVAGAVADTVLDTMVQAAPLTRAYVNNGGDIALHLDPGQRFTTAIHLHDGHRDRAHRAGGRTRASAASPPRAGTGAACPGHRRQRHGAGACAASGRCRSHPDRQCGGPARPSRDAPRPADTLDPDSDLGTRAWSPECGR
jgi:hypothetical protein